jgi:hypothetical protein
MLLSSLFPSDCLVVHRVTYSGRGGPLAWCVDVNVKFVMIGTVAHVGGGDVLMNCRT